MVEIITTDFSTEYLHFGHLLHFFPPGNILEYNIFTFLLQFLKLCTTNIWMPRNLTPHTKGSFAERTTGFLNLLSYQTPPPLVGSRGSIQALRLLGSLTPDTKWLQDCRQAWKLHISNNAFHTIKVSHTRPFALQRFRKQSLDYMQVAESEHSPTSWKCPSSCLLSSSSVSLLCALGVKKLYIVNNIFIVSKLESPLKSQCFCFVLVFRFPMFCFLLVFFFLIFFWYLWLTRVKICRQHSDLLTSRSRNKQSW